jgi:hypothetical protein
MEMSKKLCTEWKTEESLSCIKLKEKHENDLPQFMYYFLYLWIIT